MVHQLGTIRQPLAMLAVYIIIIPYSRKFCREEYLADCSNNDSYLADFTLAVG